MIKCALHYIHHIKTKIHHIKIYFHRIYTCNTLLGSPDGIAAPLFLKINVMYPPQQTQKGYWEEEAFCSLSLQPWWSADTTRCTRTAFSQLAIHQLEKDSHNKVRFLYGPSESMHIFLCQRIFSQSTLYLVYFYNYWRACFCSGMMKMKFKYNISKQKFSLLTIKVVNLVLAAIAPNTEVFRTCSIESIHQGQKFPVRTTVPVNKQILLDAN